MGQTPRVGDVEVEQDLAYQRRSWLIQRVGWAVMALVVVAALAGLFGRGPLTGATAGNDTSLIRIEYARVVRHRAAAELQVRVQPEAAQNQTIELWIDRMYLEGIEVESVVPEPESVAAETDRMVYEFAVGDLSGPTVITFNFQPIAIGPKEVRVGLVDGPDYTFTQVVFP